MIPVKYFSVSVFVLRPDGDETKVLLIRRMGHLAGLWCQTVGGIEAGEKAWQTAIREVREETGIELAEIWSTDILVQFYEADKECITLVPVFVSTVPIDTTVTLNDEQEANEWLSFEKARTMLSFSGQQKTLAAVKAEFVDKEPNPHLGIKTNG